MRITPPLGFRRKKYGEGLDATLAITRTSIQQYYAETSADYAEFWTGPDDCALHFGFGDDVFADHASTLLRTNAYLAARIAGIDGALVLDAGCGIAGSSIWLASEKTCRVIGINICFEQLLEAMRCIRRREVARAVHASMQDFHQIAMRDEAFDVVWALESTNHSVARWKLFPEFHRVLRRGGHLLLAELTIAPDAATAPSPLLETLRRGWELYGLETSGMLSDRLESAGFRILTLEDATAAVAPSVARLGELASSAAERIEERMDSGAWTARRAGNIEASAALHELLTAGAIHYTVVAAQRPS